MFSCRINLVSVLACSLPWACASSDVKPAGTEATEAIDTTRPKSRGDAGSAPLVDASGDTLDASSSETDGSSDHEHSLSDSSGRLDAGGRSGESLTSGHQETSDGPDGGKPLPADALVRDSGAAQTGDEVEDQGLVLTDYDPDTLISELDKDQFDEVCQVYKDTIASGQYAGILECLYGSVRGAANKSTTDAEFVALCEERRAGACEDSQRSAERYSMATCQAETLCMAPISLVQTCEIEYRTHTKALAVMAALLPLPECAELDRESALAFSELAQLAYLTAVESQGETEKRYFGAEGAGNACTTIGIDLCPDLLQLPPADAGAAP